MGTSDMTTAPIDIWVGTTLGLLKGVSLSAGQCFNFLPGTLSLSQTDKTREVCAMCWEHQSKEQLYLGLRSGMVQCFNCKERVFTAECDCTGGEGSFVGLGKHEDTLITCTDNGSLSYWPPQEVKSECAVGGGVSKMAASPDTLLQVATGGKENDLKLWDGNRLAAPIFQAKNVRHDSLDLRVPVWVTEIGFVPGSGSQPTIVIGTGYYQVRLYDTRAQRRPVYSNEFGESPITALDVVEDGRSFVVGNSTGDIARIDLRKGSIINRYKGFGGGVRSIQCHESTVAACGLDRYLRVYNMHPPRLLHQMYLKLQNNCILIGSEFGTKAGDRAMAGIKHKLESGESEEGSSEEEEDVWAGMETIGEKKVHAFKREKKEKSTKKRKSRTKHH